jgi:hypothetical protein
MRRYRSHHPHRSCGWLRQAKAAESVIAVPAFYIPAAASNFSPLAARVPSLYPPVICPSGVVAIFLSSPLCKNISLHPSGKSSLHIRAIPPHKRGVSRSSGNAGRDAVDAAASCVQWDRRAGFFESVSDVRHADERCCGVRRSRVVLTPRRWRQVRGCWVGPTGLQAQRQSADDGGKQARSPGRARRKPLKPLRAGMPGDSGVLVVTRVRSITTIAHEAAGAAGIRHSPRLPWAEDSYTARAHRAARRVVVCGLDVVASEATQTPSFRGDAKHRTRNLEIPRCAIAHLRSGPADHPGMTAMGLRAV